MFGRMAPAEWLSGPLGSGSRRSSNGLRRRWARAPAAPLPVCANA